MIAFVEDPTGYKFELIERPGAGDPLCQVMLRVSDLEASIRYYTECIGMTLLRKRENPGAGRGEGRRVGCECGRGGW